MYIVKFNFETNNNYRFKYIPCDMKYDGYDSYTLSKSFYNKDEAIDYIYEESLNPLTTLILEVTKVLEPTLYYKKIAKEDY